jgi:predicted nuclease of predicted toxin-antitoxin system
MKFKIDENLSESTKQLILKQHFDCHSVHDEGIAGGSDTTLIDLCRLENRHLLTLDVDFADIVRYPPENYSGITAIP